MSLLGRAEDDFLAEVRTRRYGTLTYALSTASVEYATVIETNTPRGPMSSTTATKTMPFNDTLETASLTGTGHRNDFAFGEDVSGDEQLVAHDVAEAVVDDLEAVEVDEDHRGRGAGVARHAVDEALELLPEEGAIRQAGERVRDGQLGDEFAQAYEEQMQRLAGARKL